MSAKRKHGSPNVETRSSKRKRLEAKFDSASCSAEQDTHAGSQPPLTNGATLHRCKYCQDLVFDFGQSDDDIQRIVRSLVDDESLWKECTARTLEWKNSSVEGEEKTVLNLETDRLLSRAREGCKVLEAVLHQFPVLQQWGESPMKPRVLGATFDSRYSSLSLQDIIGLPEEFLFRFPLFVLENSPLSETITKRPINKDTWSNSVRVQVKRWLQQCNENHTLCYSEQDDFWPSNLIEISKNTGRPAGFSLRLTGDFESTPRYAALSYCWGGDQILKTLKSNIDELRQDIPYDKMPATLQDAARVAFALDFRYLWIDAICLIQDLGVNEVHTLIAEIPEVYRYAALTIAAYSSPRADHGFLCSRNIGNIPGVDHTFKSRDEYYECLVQINNLYGNSGPAMLGLYEYTKPVAPIDLRGWTLQERILSRRYLIFSSLFTEWTCHECYSRQERVADGFNTSWSPHEKLLRSFSRQWITRKAPVAHGEPLNYELWHSAVSIYTGRTLGARKDVPIAISALAKDFGEAYDYAAGLWLSNLCRGLCWMTAYPIGRDDVKMDDEFYAPTWSWWTAGTQVEYPSLSETHQDTSFNLLDCTLKLAHSSAPFGYVSEASLRIEASCGEAFVGGAFVKHNNYEIWYGRSGIYRSWHSDPTCIRWDHPYSIPFGEMYWVRIIPLLYMNDDPRYCLVVRKCPGETNKAQQYYRVGLLVIQPFDHDKPAGKRYEDKLRYDDKLRFVNWLKVQPVEILTLV